MENRLGIVLSGGGARGIAHVGVLEALRERGIRPDCIAATSSGAIVAALWAAGCPASRILEFFDHKNPFRISRLALAGPGWFDTEKIADDLEEYLPAASFEELEQQLFLTATDIVEGREEVFASGDLVAAVLASASVPMLFTPVEIDGRWYVDGGVINNFPVEPLLGRCDVIVGVYASPLRRLERRELKSSFVLSLRALEVGMYYQSRRKFHLVDLLIQPPALRRFPTFDTRKHGAIFRHGYDETRREVATIERLLSRSGPRPTARAR